MGLFSRFKDPEKRKSNNNVADIKPSFPVTPSSKQRHQLQKTTTEDFELSETKKAEDIARCSKLLRQMYTLDLRIWGMKHAVGDEARQADELKQRSTALFQEVQRVVTGWAATPQSKWTVEEQDQIQRIHEILSMHEGARY